MEQLDYPSIVMSHVTSLKIKLEYNPKGGVLWSIFRASKIYAHGEFETTDYGEAIELAADRLDGVLWDQRAKVHALLRDNFLALGDCLADNPLEVHAQITAIRDNLRLLENVTVRGAEASPLTMDKLNS